jgi:hypothetical protein
MFRECADPQTHRMTSFRSAAALALGALLGLALTAQELLIRAAGLQ